MIPFSELVNGNGISIMPKRSPGIIRPIPANNVKTIPSIFPVALSGICVPVGLFPCPPISVYTFSMPRYFTLQEANATLDVIRPLIEDVQAIRRKILDKQPEAWPAMEKAAGNGGNRALSSMVQDFEKLDALIHRIQETDVLIKDINLGLLDFPALKDGREVYLCWQYGEGEIAFWHEIEAGYAGRQSIESF